MASEQDSVWKEVLDAYFEEFLAFFFPQIHADIDWQRPYEYMDKELEKLEPDSATGRRLVDKLVKVYLNDGTETWLMIHIEVQGHAEPGFAKRMNLYKNRISDHYDAEVVSLAILTDTNQSFRPNLYQRLRWGQRDIFEFLIIKLIDYNKDWASLEANPNPFAVVVMAQLKVLLVKQPQEQYNWKLQLVRMLYERNYSRQQILNLFRFIDWLMRLPDDLEQNFKQEIVKYEEARMPYVTSIERLGREEGRKEGRKEGKQEGLQEGLQILVFRQIKRRVGELSGEVAERIKKLSVIQLEDLGEALLDFTALADLENWLQAQAETPQA